MSGPPRICFVMWKRTQRPGLVPLKTSEIAVVTQKRTATIDDKHSTGAGEVTRSQCTSVLEMRRRKLVLRTRRVKLETRAVPFGVLQEMTIRHRNIPLVKALTPVDAASSSWSIHVRVGRIGTGKGVRTTSEVSFLLRRGSSLPSRCRCCPSARGAYLSEYVAYSVGPSDKAIPYTPGNKNARIMYGVFCGQLLTSGDYVFPGSWHK